MRKLFLWILLAALCAGLTSCAGTPPESHADTEESPEHGALSAETLQTLFTGVTAYQGSAGSALRNAQGACNLLAFAESADYANISLTSREESVSGAYLSMSDEQREEFAANFADILEFMESAFRDYASVRGVLDDGGVADTMDSLMDAENARAQWDALSSDILKVAGEDSTDWNADELIATPQNSGVGNVLAADVRSRMKDETAENSPVFGSQALRRNQILSVTFLSDVSRAPEKGWDVSQAGDSSVMAWVEESDGGGLYDLYIAGNGGVVAPDDCGGLFFGYSKMERVAFNSAFDTSGVTSMREMFSACRDLKSLDVSAFRTEKVTNMDSMFRTCASLRELDVSAFDTSNVADMSGMFNQCAALSRLNLSGFDTSGVTDMSFMFYRCSSLTDLEISGFDTSNVTNMRSMFYGCSSLSDLEISGFDTSRVTDMSGMFAGCSALTALNLNNFDLSAVEDMAHMFVDCASLKTLDMNGFAISEVADTTGVFNGYPVTLEKG